MTLSKTNLLMLLVFFCLPASAQRHSVLIHEIMADPQPTIDLPDAEYVELRNTSTTPIDLAGWRLQTGSATSGTFPHYTLLPDSLVVLTSRTNARFFGTNTLGISSFPALPNSGSTLVLLDPFGLVVHAVAYQISWYQNEVKAEGGWSLEMVDASNPCAGAANWKAAQHPSGGTPGKPNSVQAINRDETPPALLAATAPDSLHLLLHFDEGLDSATAAATGNYRLEPQLSVLEAVPQAPSYQQVLIRLQTPMQPGAIYTLHTSGIADCAGNIIGLRNKVPAGLPQSAVAGDVVINEILFNPKPDGADYVELYNRSKKIIDASRLWMSNGSNTPQRIAIEPRYLFPGQYAAITENREAVLRHFLVKAESTLWEVSTLPSLPDDRGTFKLLNEQGQTVDELTYSHNWHFALLADKEGVALERIDPNGPTQKSDNWTSAAAAVGFGTPTYQNSQHQQPVASAATWSISPKVFSPDGDGFDDFCTISYQLDAPNYVANLRIFDAGGRLVRYLVQNETLSQNGFWRWDGLNDKNAPLPTGTYILLLEIFNLQGKKQQWKKTVTLARRR